MLAKLMTPKDAKLLVQEMRSLANSREYTRILHRSAQLAKKAEWAAEPKALATDLTLLANEGPILAMMAIESLAGIDHQVADSALTSLLQHSQQIVRRHAAWRLGAREAVPEALSLLIEMVALGGIDSMHAHRTLAAWSSQEVAISALAIHFLTNETDAAVIARLEDLLSALKQPPAIGVPFERPRLEDRRGLRIAQLVLSSALDDQLSLGGRGDTGGVANLLVSLGEAFAERADVDQVFTISRGRVTSVSPSEVPLTYGTIAFGDDVRPAETPSDIWEHLPAIKRGIRDVLNSAGQVDVLHLRMADAGTLAGAEVAKALGIPICFSVAPDPHNVIESLEARGELDDERFVHLVTDSHLWFRARLVEELTRNSQQLALFPRTKQIDFLSDLNVSVSGEVEAHTTQEIAVVAEGIDVGMLERARRQHSNEPSGHTGDVLDELANLIPPQRRGLPLVLSVGRLNPVKGMDRVVSAWASNPMLCEASNLVIVGGDLGAPSAVEEAVLDSIASALPDDDPNQKGLILLGGRPRQDIARLLVATAQGRRDAWACGGVYVDGALKEEFGLAVLEALAAGLVVVAPSVGGPSTYVVQGDTGVLVDPGADLGAAIENAFSLVSKYGRAERALDMVESRYSIDMMAERLVQLYRPPAAQ
jgi:glycosyltransferase involved in cell wall biosynthesis